MSNIKRSLKKEIVSTLSEAIDEETNDNDYRAFYLYNESLKLVATALQENAVNTQVNLTQREKKNLIEFAKQSVARLDLILKKSDRNDSFPLEACAPTENDINKKLFGSASPCKVIEEQLVDNESKLLVERYQRRITSAATASEKQNLELELARQLVENMSIARKKILEATSYSMQMSEKIFSIQEKLASGNLRESDLKKQQLYAMSFQFQQCNPSVETSITEARGSLHGESLIRELISLGMESEGHPLECALKQMHRTLTNNMSSANRDAIAFSTLASDIKEDLSILMDTLKALFSEIQNEKGSVIAFKHINQLYFSPVKHLLVKFIRECSSNVEMLLKKKLDSYNGSALELDEDDRKEAVTKLHYLTTLANPYDMMDCCIHVIKLLATSPFERDHCTSIGADELLPRLSVVVKSSKLPSLHAELVFLETFTPSDRALGEGGYAVTMLRSAVSVVTGIQFDTASSSIQ